MGYTETFAVPDQSNDIDADFDWDLLQGTCDIDNEAASIVTVSSGGSVTARCNESLGTNGMRATWTGTLPANLASQNFWFGPAVRLSPSAMTGYVVQFLLRDGNNNAARLYIMEAGVLTELSNPTWSSANNEGLHEFWLEVEDSGAGVVLTWGVDATEVGTYTHTGNDIIDDATYRYAGFHANRGSSYDGTSVVDTFAASEVGDYGTTVGPSRISVSTSVGTPAIGTNEAVTVEPATIEVTTSIDTYTASTQQRVTPSTIDVSVSLGSVTLDVDETGPADGSTLDTLVERTRQLLLGGMREKLNWVDGLVSASATDIVLADDVTGIKPGTLVEHGTEVWYVRSVNTGTRTITVRRGMNGSQPTIVPDDAVVRIDPHYLTADIVTQLQAEVSALNGTGIAFYEPVKISFSHTQQVYNLQIATTAAELIDVYDVTYERSEATGPHRPVRYRVRRHRDEDDFTSGIGLEVLSGGYEGAPLTVVVKRSMTVPDDLDDIVDVPEYAVAVLPVGAAWRLALGMEARRVNPKAEHGSRRAEEVPANSNAFLARAFESMRHDLVEQALEVQLRRYPPLFKD